MRHRLATIDIGERGRPARKAQGLRQDELAGAASVGLRFIVELGADKPTAQLGKVLQVLDALGCRLESENVVPLTPSAVTILEAQPTRDGCEYVFSTNGRTPHSGSSKSKASPDRAIQVARKKAAIKNPMPSWRLHDLRRTARTITSRAGVPSDTAERVLGHRIQGVRRTYDRHDYIAKKRDALTRLGAIIARILNATGANAVLPAPVREVSLDAASDKQRAGLAEASQRAGEEPEHPSDLGQH